MLELLGEAISFTLEALSFRLIHGGVAHAGALRVRVGVVHSESNLLQQKNNFYIIN